MILQVIRGRARPDQVDALGVALDEKTGSNGHEDGGPIRLHWGTRPAGEELDAIIISSWLTFEAAMDADARGISPLGIARATLPTAEAAHFELDETIVRNSAQAAIAIRLGIGRFSKPGSDIEMLETLRQRVPLVGDEMSEAYVGRRMVGHSVEVAFVSAWQRLPTDRVLEESFWSDVALRYDEFTVEVYSTMAGSGS